MDESGLVNLSRKLRHKETEPEQILWSWLRNKQLDGVKFRRQQLIGHFIVDFVSFEKSLIIEIDGGQHTEDRSTKKDELRTKWLESRSFRVLRFWNNDVLENIDGVIANIKDVIE